MAGPRVKTMLQTDFDERPLDNPELEDLVDLIEAIVRREAKDIMALGKRLAAMLKLAKVHDTIAVQYGLPQVSLNR